MGAMQPSHWIILIAVILLLFGASRLPGLAKSVGQSMKIFKNEVKDLRSDDNDKPDTTTDRAADRTGGTAAAERGGSTTTEPYTPGGAPKGDDAPRA